MKAFLIILGILAAIGVGIVSLVYSGVIKLDMASAKTDVGGTIVRVDLVRHGDLVEIVAAPGTVVPETNVSISARVNAKILELPFKVGDAITKGNPTASPPIPPSILVRLDSSDLDADLRAAQARHAGQLAEMDTAKARIEARIVQARSQAVQLENRQTELERQEALLATEDVSKQVVDDLRAAVNQLKAQIEGDQGSIAADRVALKSMEYSAAAAQAEIDRITDSLQYTMITSPIDGVVTKVNVEAGEIAVTGTMNNAGTVLLEVADLSKMLVEARVDETDIAAVEKEQKAIVRMEAYSGMKFDGVVTTVALARSTEETDRTQYYEVKVLLDRKGRNIVSGLTADVEIETHKHTHVLRVPSQSVVGRAVDALPAGIRDQPEVDVNRTFVPVVYRIVNGKAVVTPVRVGASDMTHTIIESGLSENDAIVVGPFKVLESIQHDQSIRDEKATTQPTTTKS